MVARLRRPTEFQGHAAARRSGREAETVAMAGVAITETQRDLNTPADHCRPDRPGHGTSRSASHQLAGPVSGVPWPVTGHGHERPPTPAAPDWADSARRSVPDRDGGERSPPRQASARNCGQHEHRIEGGDRDPGGRAEFGCARRRAFPQPPPADTQGITTAVWTTMSSAISSPRGAVQP